MGTRMKTVRENPAPAINAVPGKKDWIQKLEKDIEEARKKNPQHIKDWMSTPCMIDIINIVKTFMFEVNSSGNRSMLRRKVRPILNQHGLERTRIRCNRDHNKEGGDLHLEVHRPTSGDGEDYMKFTITHSR